VAKLIVTLEISMGDGNPDNYKGLIDEMLEESRHWGDFDCKVVQQTIIDDETGETYPLGFFDKK